MSGDGLRPRVFYAPWTPELDGWSIERMNVMGARWLMAQRGSKLVLVESLGNYRQNPMARHTPGVTVAKPVKLWESDWNGGPVLAPWPSSKILDRLSDGLRGRVTVVGVIPWGDGGEQTAWLDAHGAISMVDGSVFRRADGPLLDPVVEAAMTELGQLVNHSNGLVGPYERPRTIEILRLLHRAGHRWDVDQLCAWALTHGFTASEVGRLRDYAAKVLAGHNFRIGKSSYGPGAVERWRQAAAAGARTEGSC